MLRGRWSIPCDAQRKPEHPRRCSEEHEALCRCSTQDGASVKILRGIWSIPDDTQWNIEQPRRCSERTEHPRRYSEQDGASAPEINRNRPPHLPHDRGEMGWTMLAPNLRKQRVRGKDVGQDSAEKEERLRKSNARRHEKRQDDARTSNR